MANLSKVDKLPQEGHIFTIVDPPGRGPVVKRSTFDLHEGRILTSFSEDGGYPVLKDGDSSWI